MRNLILMSQVHGNNVVVVSKKDVGRTIPKCDGLVTKDKNITLCVRVADCLPISIRDRKGCGIGLIHAGWRGLDSGIINNAIKIIGNDVSVEIGPHICQKHYEVKRDVSKKFTKYPDVIFKKDGKEFLDLGRVAELQLIKAGVKKENIKIDKICTFEDGDLFSYRRGDETNRNMYTLTVF